MCSVPRSPASSVKRETRNAPPASRRSDANAKAANGEGAEGFLGRRGDSYSPIGIGIADEDESADPWIVMRCSEGAEERSGGRERSEREREMEDGMFELRTDRQARLKVN